MLADGPEENALEQKRRELNVLRPATRGWEQGVSKSKEADYAVKSILGNGYRAHAWWRRPLVMPSVGNGHYRKPTSTTATTCGFCGGHGRHESGCAYENYGYYASHKMS